MIRRMTPMPSKKEISGAGQHQNIQTAPRWKSCNTITRCITTGKKENSMGKASRRKKAARAFREEQEVSKDQFTKALKYDKSDVSYDVPVIRHKWKVKNKYPRAVATTKSTHTGPISASAASNKNPRASK
jgi:hypothetical protein